MFLISSSRFRQAIRYRICCQQRQNQMNRNDIQ